MVMDYLNQREIESAMDALAQRIMAVQQAKKKDGKWEKAELIELLPAPGSGVMPAGMRALLQ